MRIKGSVEDISTDKVKEFYEHRASSYNGENIYNVTMLQDKNPELSEERNKADVAKILPKLKLDENSCVLDLACGVGRLLDAMPENIKLYRGIDFSESMIELASSRNTRTNAKFFTGSVLDVDKILADELGSFNRVLMIAFFMYMNDDDILALLKKIPALMTQKGGLICVKASIGVNERLTLKDFYSEELKSDYESIYRTRDEYMKFFEQTLIPEGFTVTEENYLYDDDNLNNRKETTQYYFILER